MIWPGCSSMLISSVESLGRSESPWSIFFVISSTSINRAPTSGSTPDTAVSEHSKQYLSQNNQPTHLPKAETALVKHTVAPYTDIARSDSIWFWTISLSLCRSSGKHKHFIEGESSSSYHGPLIFTTYRGRQHLCKQPSCREVGIMVMAAMIYNWWVHNLLTVQSRILQTFAQQAAIGYLSLTDNAAIGVVILRRCSYGCCQAVNPLPRSIRCRWEGRKWRSATVVPKQSYASLPISMSPRLSSLLSSGVMPCTVPTFMSTWNLTHPTTCTSCSGKWLW